MDEKSRSAANTNDPRVLASLQQIANLLGCPVSAFFDTADRVGVSGMVEMFELWSEIREPRDRLSVLTLMRELARPCPVDA